MKFPQTFLLIALSACLPAVAPAQINSDELAATVAAVKAVRAHYAAGPTSLVMPQRDELAREVGRRIGAKPLLVTSAYTCELGPRPGTRTCRLREPATNLYLGNGRVSDGQWFFVINVHRPGPGSDDPMSTEMHIVRVKKINGAWVATVEPGPLV